MAFYKNRQLRKNRASGHPQQQTQQQIWKPDRTRFAGLRWLFAPGGFLSERPLHVFSIGDTHNDLHPFQRWFLPESQPSCGPGSLNRPTGYRHSDTGPAHYLKRSNALKYYKGQLKSSTRDGHAGWRLQCLTPPWASRQTVGSRQEITCAIWLVFLVAGGVAFVPRPLRIDGLQRGASDAGNRHPHGAGGDAPQRGRSHSVRGIATRGGGCGWAWVCPWRWA